MVGCIQYSSAISHNPGNIYQWKLKSERVCYSPLIAALVGLKDLTCRSQSVWHAIIHRNNVCIPSAATHYNNHCSNPGDISVPPPQTVCSCSGSQRALVCNTGSCVRPTQYTEVRTWTLLYNSIVCSYWIPRASTVLLWIWSVPPPTAHVLDHIGLSKVGISILSSYPFIGPQ
jgi:hypothetical protein